MYSRLCAKGHENRFRQPRTEEVIAETKCEFPDCNELLVPKKIVQSPVSDVKKF